MDAAGEEMAASSNPSLSETCSDAAVITGSSASRDENIANEAAVDPARVAEWGETEGEDTRETAETDPPLPQQQQRGKGQEAGKRDGAGHDSSKQLSGSSKLEDQINLQHLVELMKIFYVSWGRLVISVMVCVCVLGGR